MPSSRMLPQTRCLTLSIVVAICLSIVSPFAVSTASANPGSGDIAIITDANGDTVRLRVSPGTLGAVIAEYPEGTSVTVLDGPHAAEDGTAWYRVSVDGQTGYMAAMFLSPGAAFGPAPTPTAEPIVVAAGITGSGTIVNTNGDPIRCRASASVNADIVGYLYEGMALQLTGNPSGEWLPVLCENRDGWVHTDFISTGGSVQTPTPNPTPEPTEALVTAASLTGTATVTGTNGDGVRCRSEATTSGSTITTLAEGSSVALRGARNGNWQPVTCAGRDGFVWAAFLAVSSSNRGVTGSDTVTGTAFVANTNGQGLRCRASAGFDGTVITVLVEGTALQLRGSKTGDWQPVFCSGSKGFVHGDYVSTSSGGNTGGNTGGGSTGLKNGDSAQVNGTNGDGVRFRSAASSSASIITVLAEGVIVDVVAGSTGDWVAVKYRGSNGFVHKDYLIHATTSGSPQEPSNGLVKGDRAAVTTTLNFRAGASTTASVIGVAMEGTVVLITGNRQNGFFPVDWSGQAGFMHGDYLKWTANQPSPGSGGTGGDAGNGTPSSVGQAMVNYAMGYIGYPYIWATAGPNSFDCSGFTYWVTKHVLGQDIGRGLWTQVVAGKPVSYGNLRPGDLVFFQNTYTWGLSHVGIYIGNNQFIHAENEDTGVRISSITSTYYATRYYGAVRMG